MKLAKHSNGIAKNYNNIPLTNNNNTYVHNPVNVNVNFEHFAATIEKQLHTINNLKNENMTWLWRGVGAGFLFGLLMSAMIALIIQSL